MLIVVESGSTKADWMIWNHGIKTLSSTMGFNPNFHSKSEIVKALEESSELSAVKNEVRQLYFYGAGCSTPELSTEIKNSLSAFFSKARIYVESDLTASAYACYSGESEIACILGTGSNSCFYDGKTVREEVPALGYVLGDEGSGTYFGKRMLADYLYKKLPNPMNEAFIEMGLNKQTILKRVYQESGSNVFIASLMPVLIANKGLPYSQNLIRKGFQEFIDTHVMCYPEYINCEVNFVGSVADLLQNELMEVCKLNDIKVGRIIRRPLEQLVAFHLRDGEG
jgi:N-acetylglucosamine kinase-like BadF-type ATPase